MDIQIAFQRENGVQSISKLIHTWDTARRIIQMIHMIIIRVSCVYTVICFTQPMGAYSHDRLVRAGRPAET